MPENPHTYADTEQLFNFLDSLRVKGDREQHEEAVENHKAEGYPATCPVGD